MALTRVLKGPTVLMHLAAPESLMKRTQNHAVNKVTLHIYGDLTYLIMWSIVLLILIVIRLSGVGSRGSSSSSGKLCALDILLCGNVCALYILYHIGYLNISYGDI
jgi:hypothetical protein